MRKKSKTQDESANIRDAQRGARDPFLYISHERCFALFRVCRVAVHQ